MSAFIKGAALFVLIGCSIWVAVLWRWEATARDMSTGDIVVYLALLPLTVFALALLLRWAWQGAEQRQASAVSAAAVSPAVAAASASADTGDARRHASLQLLAAHVGCAAGASAAELQAAAQAGTPRPALDPELRDDEGLPVFAARMADLEPAAIVTLLEPHLAATRTRRPEWVGLAANEHVQRALAALQEPLAQAVSTLAAWYSRPGAPTDAPLGTPVGQRVRVLLGWPADWTAFEQELGRAFATELIRSRGAPIPETCFVVSQHPGGGEDLLLHADRMLQTLAREGHDEPLIVAACYSAISEAAIEAIERDGALFSSQKRPKGRMPGEAAAAIVLAGAQWPAAADAQAPTQHLHRPAVARRDKSIDAAGRVSGDTLAQAMTQALATSGLGADAIAALVCDADQHTARSTEIHAATLGLLPHLDSGDDLRLIGTVTGAVGAVSALLVIACAAERARSVDGPCLAVTLGDPFARLALVVLPGPPPVANRGAAAASTGAAA